MTKSTSCILYASVRVCAWTYMKYKLHIYFLLSWDLKGVMYRNRNYDFP